MPEPYNVNDFLRLLGIEVVGGRDEPLMARLIVRHDLIAPTGYLWAPVASAVGDVLCRFGVSRNWPQGAQSFATVECKSNFYSSAQEGEKVVATAEAIHLGRSTEVWDASVRNESTGRHGVVPLYADDPVRIGGSVLVSPSCGVYKTLRHA